MLTEYPNAALFKVDVMKNKVTIIAHRKNGICRGLRKHVAGENLKWHGNPSNATNTNWKKVIEIPGFVRIDMINQVPIFDSSLKKVSHGHNMEGNCISASRVYTLEQHPPKMSVMIMIQWGTVACFH